MQYAETIATGDHPPEPPTRRLREALEEAAHALPTQGPLSVFVHHNTLHAFEHLPFHEAIARASDELDTHGYLTEPELRAAYARGRIDDEDLAAAIDDYLRAGELPRSSCPLPDATLLGIALRHPLPVPSEAGLRWELDEHHARTRLRPDVPPAARERFLARSVRWLSALDPDALRAAVGGEPPPRSLARDPEAWAVAALFEACRGVRSRAEPPRRTAVRSHRELLLEATGIDPAAHVNPWLVRFLAAFLDHGLAEWPMPGRERGMLECFLAHLETPGLPLPAAVDEARALAREARRRALGAEDLVREALDELGVREADRAAYLRRVLLALPGWAGMVHRLESHPEERPPAAGAPSLMELAAIRLILDRAAWARLARRELDYRGPLAELPAFLARRAPRPRVDRPAEGAAAFRLFCVAQLAGLTGEEVLAMGPDGRQAIVDRLDAFDERARRRTLFEAYERHHRERVLAVLAKRRERPVAEPASPRWQLVFCIDDRAESFRRHVEELAPDVQTFGVAGYFGLAIEYVSLDGTSTRLCPAGVVPAHSVREMPEPEHETWIDAHAVRRGVLATAARFGLRGSRALVRGTLLGPPIGFALALPFAVRL
ncbi:MAG TPA: putative inorganic carbon transporter subunit DabA, partial [Sandaracinaceae bacterium]